VVQTAMTFARHIPRFKLSVSHKLLRAPHTVESALALTDYVAGGGEIEVIKEASE